MKPVAYDVRCQLPFGFQQIARLHSSSTSIRRTLLSVLLLIHGEHRRRNRIKADTSNTTTMQWPSWPGCSRASQSS